MFKYEFERIYNNISGFGMLSGTKYHNDNYKKIISQRAEDGWRYVGFIPSVQRGTGHIEEMDLIFEKEEKWNSQDISGYTSDDWMKRYDAMYFVYI